ncbi:MAG: winged helix-turn-helix transcriptional regulator [Bacillaceae bacterium]|nr:winged helix-turn-helix transcriptional regulator [Bacillaceae bacterium]
MDRDPAQLLNQYWNTIYYCLHYPHKESISHQAVRLLQHIEMNGPSTIGQLAKWLSVSHNTASEHVKRLMGKGLIRKQRSPEDERKVFVALTEQGKTLLHRHTRLDESKLNRILENLSTEERATVEKAFQLLAEEAKQCFSS